MNVYRLKNRQKERLLKKENKRGHTISPMHSDLMKPISEISHTSSTPTTFPPCASADFRTMLRAHLLVSLRDLPHILALQTSHTLLECLVSYLEFEQRSVDEAVYCGEGVWREKCDPVFGSLSHQGCFCDNEPAKRSLKHLNCGWRKE